MRLAPRLLWIVLVVGCSTKADLPVLNSIPNFNLTERSGRSFTREELAGKVWIADFIFTRCAGICPAMSTHMQRLQERLPQEVSLVSFTVDPAHDTPEVLTAYAERYGADRDRWLFLTGDAKQLYSLSYDGFKLAVSDEGTDAEPITHSSRFVLVDAEGRIRGYYSTEDEGSLDRLVQDATELL